MPPGCAYPVPLNEKVLADYSCAYVKNSLVHGRMYVSPSCVLFTGQLFGTTIIYTSAPAKSGCSAGGSPVAPGSLALLMLGLGLAVVLRRRQA